MKALIRAAAAAVQRAGYRRRLNEAKAIAADGALSKDAITAWEALIPDRGRLSEEEIRAILEAPRGEAFVSIIIPSKDQPAYLARCINSLLETIDPVTEHLSYEIIVVDNGSNPKNRINAVEILNNAKQTSSPADCKYLYRSEEFHFSRMCNRGAEEAGGSLLLFLNDDTEARVPGWLSTLAAFASDSRTGAVGTKLLYPAGEKEVARIQHCGIVNAFYGPVHALCGATDGTRHFWDYADTVRSCVAVTGACLMIRRDLFHEVGGFCMELPVAFNDVDLCYTLHEKGLRNLAVNTVYLTHHESVSRGIDTQDAGKLKRLQRETEILTERHPELSFTDPYFDARLSLSTEIAPRYGMTGKRVGDLSAQRGTPFSPKREGYRKDACVYVHTEYAGAAKDSGIGEAKDKDLLLCGFSFVAGSDNALYERFAVLRRTDGDKEALRFEVTDAYRADVSALFDDQEHCELSGFMVRIAHDAIPAGSYRVGMCVRKRHTAQRLINWSRCIFEHAG